MAVKTVSFHLDEHEVEILWALRWLNEWNGPIGRAAGEVFRAHLRALYERNGELQEAVEMLRTAKGSYIHGSDAPIRHLSLVR